MQLPTLTPTDILLLVLLVACAGLIKGFAGFGGALVMAPFLSRILGPLAAVPLVALLEMSANLQLLPASFRAGEVRRVARLGLVGSLFIPFGVSLLVRLPREILIATFHGAVVVFSMALLLTRRTAVRPASAGSAGSGNAVLGFLAAATSGFAAGMSGLGGPPIVLYMATRPTSSQLCRSNLVLYFPFLSVGMIVLFAMHHLWSKEIVLLAAGLVPVTLGGAWLGGHIFGRAGGSYRSAILLFLAVVSALGLVVH